jgi:hypothetical protein
MLPPLRLPPKSRAELVEWLNKHGFTRFVTLATNDPSLSSVACAVRASARGADRLTTLVRRWDALMNRAIVGPKWAKDQYRCDRLFACYFLEKPEANPHWHALVRIDDQDPDRRSIKSNRFDELVDVKWRELISSGSTDVQTIADHLRVTDYVAKELGNPLSYERMIVADQFSR